MTDRYTLWLTVTIIVLLVLLVLLTAVRGETTNRVPILLPTMLLVTSNGVSVAATLPTVRDWGTVTDLDSGETIAVVQLGTGWQPVSQLPTQTQFIHDDGCNCDREWLRMKE
jgi:hypothetical protein